MHTAVDLLLGQPIGVLLIWAAWSFLAERFELGMQHVACIEPLESSAGNDVRGEEVGEREVGVTHPPRGEGAVAFLNSLCRDVTKSVLAARLLEQHFRQVQYSLSQSVA